MSTHFLNGNFVSEDGLVISPRDIGYSRGYAVFDYLRTYRHHRPFRLKEHIERLFYSAEQIGLKLPWSKKQVLLWVLETLNKNSDDEEKSIKILISGGVSNTMHPSGDPTIIILIDSVVQYPKHQYKKGVAVFTVKHQRYIPGAKSNHYIEGVKQAQVAKTLGAAEPVYFSDKQVFEGSNSNIFAVIDGELLTPKTDILLGVTRAVLLEILNLDIPVKTKDFTLDELRHASEVFLSGSGKEIVPVVTIDSKPVGNGQVGPITTEVIKQFAKYTQSNQW